MRVQRARGDAACWHAAGGFALWNGWQLHDRETRASRGGRRVGCAMQQRTNGLGLVGVFETNSRDTEQGQRQETVHTGQYEAQSTVQIGAPFPRASC